MLSFRKLLVVMTVAGVFACMTPAVAERRVALVIGNANYTHVPSLENPVNDARIMADTLRAVGFKLVGDAPQINLDDASFRRAVQSFGNELQGADVALFYFAGHGVQVRGGNYLVPVAANPVREADVDFEMIDVSVVLRQMESAGAGLNLVILDACRNNPFGARGLRSSASGLAQMQAPQGTLISFATQPGNVALDGKDSNSPYTRALVQAIKKPGLDIFRTFNEVGLAVASSTGGAQQPWFSLSPIKGEFFFSGRSEEIGVLKEVDLPEPAASALTRSRFSQSISWAGLKSRFLTDEAEAKALKLSQGAYVTEVADDGPAKVAGIEVGDVVTQVGTVAIRNPLILAGIFRDTKPGTSLNLTFHRGGKTMRANLVLAELPLLIAIGFDISELSIAVRKEFAISKSVKSGLVVTKVSSGIRGLAIGDIITAVAQKPVNSEAEFFAEYMAARQKSPVVILSVSNDSGARFVAVSLSK
jgi:hypothetical protein